MKLIIKKKVNTIKICNNQGPNYIITHSCDAVAKTMGTNSIKIQPNS